MSLVISNNISLASYTSWLVGGPAQYFCRPVDQLQMEQAIHFASQNKLPITIIGWGSNVLISDRGVDGLVICMRQFAKVETKIENNRIYINAFSGTSKSELLKIFLKNKLQPALFLAGLPGDIGGGIVMNAGVAENYSPREFLEIVDEITVLRPDGKYEIILKKDLQVSYRHTYGWQPGIIISAQISWPLEPDETILQKVKDANRSRLSKQPLDMPSCGSVFKNPEGNKAAQLIDQCGLKGFKIGDAQVSEKHANFIVNLENATAKDIWSVIIHVQKTVLNEKNVSLTTEVVRLGHWD